MGRVMVPMLGGSVLYICTKFESHGCFRSKVIGVQNFSIPQTSFAGRGMAKIETAGQGHYLHVQTVFGQDRCTQFRVIVITVPRGPPARSPQTNKHTHSHRQDRCCLAWWILEQFTTMEPLSCLPGDSAISPVVITAARSDSISIQQSFEIWSQRFSCDPLTPFHRKLCPLVSGSFELELDQIFQFLVPM